MDANGHWIQTASGRAFDPWADEATLRESICAPDVFHGLSLVNRFAGHTSRPYTVATHSALVQVILGGWEASPVVRLFGLLHDGSEAYLGDVPSPFKAHPDFAPYRALERRVQDAVYVALAGRVPDEEEAAQVAKADFCALAVERSMVLGRAPRPWAIPESDLRAAFTEVPDYLRGWPFDPERGGALTVRSLLLRYHLACAAVGPTAVQRGQTQGTAPPSEWGWTGWSGAVRDGRP
jgi:hypothetical protein